MSSPAAAGARRRPLAARLGMALLLTAASAAVTYLLQDYLSSAIFIFFYPTLILAAWYGGFPAGALVAVAAVLVVDVLFLPPIGRLQLPSASDLTVLSLFLFLAAVVTVLVNGMQAAQAAAAQREREARALALRLEAQAQQLELQASDLEEQTVELEHAMTEAEAARAHAEAAYARSEHERRRVAILAETSRALTESHDYRARLQALGELVVRELADHCLVDVVAEDGSIERVVSVTRHPANRALMERARAFVPQLDRPSGPGRVLRTGEPEIRLEMPTELAEAMAVSDEHLAMIRELAPHSLIVMPLVASQRRLGALTVVRTPAMPRFDEDDVELVRVMATRAALLIELARLYHEAVLEIERRRTVEGELTQKAAQLQEANARLEDIMSALAERTDRAEAAERTARDASEAKTQFLAVMSHELRTPLNAIMGYTDLLQSGAAGVELNDTARGFLDRVRASVLHLRGLIDEVLSLSRIEAGKEQVVLERTNLAAVIRDVAAMVQADALSKGLRVELHSEGDVIVTTDPGKLRQILINLASNAVKFTDQGTVRLALRSRRGLAEIEVSDTGTGIAAEHQERIFEPFTQVDQSRTRRAGGTGLGLAVSRKFARLLGGDIRLRSETGQGSHFTLTLPIEPAADAVAGAQTRTG